MCSCIALNIMQATYNRQADDWSINHISHALQCLQCFDTSTTTSLSHHTVLTRYGSLLQGHTLQRQ